MLPLQTSRPNKSKDASYVAADILASLSFPTTSVCLLGFFQWEFDLTSLMNSSLRTSCSTSSQPTRSLLRSPPQRPTSTPHSRTTLLSSKRRVSHKETRSTRPKSISTCCRLSSTRPTLRFKSSNRCMGPVRKLHHLRQQQQQHQHDSLPSLTRPVALLRSERHQTLISIRSLLIRQLGASSVAFDSIGGV